MAALTWVLQENLRDRAFLAELETCLDELGVAWCSVPVVPFSAELPVLPAEVEAGAIVCYGPSFVPRVADRRSWARGIFFDRDAFRWSAMRAGWGELMFASDGRVTSLESALAELDATAGEAFVRPDADSKSFDGGVYDASTLRLAGQAVDRDTAVIVAAPQSIDAEWRCFVIDGQLIDSCEYRRAGRPSLHRGAPPRVCELAEQAAVRWLPARVTCIDVASSGDRFGIVEANCFNASRFYAVDAALILDRVSRAVRGD